MHSFHLKTRSLRLLCLAAFIIVEDTPFSHSTVPNFFAYGALTQANTKMLKKNKDGQLVTDKDTRGFRHLRAKHNIFLDELGDHLVEEDVAEDATSKSMKSKKSYGESGVDSDEVPTGGSKRSKAMPSSQKTGKEQKRGNKKRGKKKKGKQADKKSEFWDSCILCYISSTTLLSQPPNSFTRCLW